MVTTVPLTMMGGFGLSAGVLDAAVALLWVVSGFAAESPLLLQPAASSSSDEERTNGAAYRFMRSVADTCASRWDVGSSRPEALWLARLVLGQWVAANGTLQRLA